MRIDAGKLKLQLTEMWLGYSRTVVEMLWAFNQINDFSSERYAFVTLRCVKSIPFPTDVAN